MGRYRSLIMPANLHRVGKQADWEMIPVDERNIFQQIASVTKGVATPANAVSFYGASKVVKGLYDINKGDTLNGILSVGIGRLADIVDGTVANATGTKSAVGEGVDATLDKLTAVVAVPVLVRNNIISRKFAGFTVAQNIANTGLTAIAKRRGQEIHSTWAGKRSTGFLWTAIGLKGLAKAVRNGELSKVGNRLSKYGLNNTADKIKLMNNTKLARKIDAVGILAGAIYIALGSYATSEYARTAFSRKSG